MMAVGSRQYGYSYSQSQAKLFIKAHTTIGFLLANIIQKYLTYHTAQGLNDDNAQDCVSEHSDTCGNSHNGVIINVRKLLSPSTLLCSPLIG